MLLRKIFLGSLSRIKKGSFGAYFSTVPSIQQPSVPTLPAKIRDLKDIGSKKSRLLRESEIANSSQ